MGFAGGGLLHLDTVCCALHFFGSSSFAVDKN